MSDACFECGAPPPLRDHHVVPRSRGGNATVLLCPDCHGLVHDIEASNLTADALARRRINGLVYGPTPYGYRREGDTLQPHRDELATVRRIHELARAGQSNAEIARRLAVDKVPTKRGGKWERATVRYILRNPLYAGVVGRLS